MGLRKIGQEELDNIVKLHKKWIYGSYEGAKADLSYTDFTNVDLKDANLWGANLSHSDLRGVDLSGAFLSDVNLSSCNLKDANLSSVCLCDANLNNSILARANLAKTNLRDANLSDADLRKANLKDSYLIGVNFKNAILTDVDFSNADIREANLKDSCLIGANLDGVKYNYATSFFTLQCPEKGSFIGYKKSGDKIVELRIEEDSLRSSATSSKCRASKVTVLSITNTEGTEEFEETSNTGCYKFTYKVGETYEVKDFDKDRWRECATGIHFFITRDEAILYR